MQEPMRLPAARIADERVDPATGPSISVRLSGKLAYAERRAGSGDSERNWRCRLAIGVCNDMAVRDDASHRRQHNSDGVCRAERAHRDKGIRDGRIAEQIRLERQVHEVFLLRSVIAATAKKLLEKGDVSRFVVARNHF
jgi:hypothetical protein